MAGGRPVWRIDVDRPEGPVVSAIIDGHRVEVRSDDVPLRSVPEAWATAMCLPAARAGATLDLGEPIDPEWAVGAAANVAAAASWWGGDDHLPMPVPRRLRRWGGRSRARRAGPAPGRALCFTGGVDSFFSLLAGDHRPTHLLYVGGFDVRLHEAERLADVERLVRSVAAGLGLDAVVVRTDLLYHPRFSSISWEHTHGAAIAAIGHLLAPAIGTTVVPPSYGVDRLVPWGSRPDLDPRWSIPGRSVIEHGDASGHRIDRVMAIAHDDLVAEHLRVCWANVGTELNCGRCEKCVRTMAMFDAAGTLDRLRTLPGPDALVIAVDHIDALDPAHRPMWVDLLSFDLTPDVRGALERLLARSPS